MNPQYPLLGVKENTGNVVLTDSQKNTLWWTKAVLAVLALISGGIALGLVLGIPETWTIFLQNVTLVRNSNIVPGAVAADGYPGYGIIPTPDADNINEITPTVDVGLVAAFVSILAFVGYAFSLLFHNSEIEQMNRGANPFVFIFSSFWTPVAFLVYGFVAGIPNLFVLTFIGLMTWAWLWLFWADDLMHSHAYRATTELASQYAQQAGMADASMWSWVAYVQGLLFAIATYVIIFVYLGYTWSAEVEPPSAFMWIPIVGMVIYLGIPIIILVHCQKWLIGTLYGREMWLYIWSFVSVLVATWLTLIIFATQTPFPATP